MLNPVPCRRRRSTSATLFPSYLSRLPTSLRFLLFLLVSLVTRSQLSQAMAYPPSPPSSTATSSSSSPSISFDHYVHYAGKAAELAREAILQLPSLQHRLNELESELQVVSGEVPSSLSFVPELIS